MIKYSRLKDTDLSKSINGRVFVKFMLKKSEIKTQKDGKTEYLNLSISDKTVTLNDVKWFNITEKDKSIISDGLVYIGALDVQAYDKSSSGYSCKIYNLQMYSEDNSDYIDVSKGVSEAYEIISNAMQDINGTVYGTIASNLIKKYWESFRVWTAASSMHHNKISGLMVHTAEVVDIASSIADKINELYGEEFIDKDLLVGSAIIHDIGKCMELDVNTVTGSTKYSANGALESHLTNLLGEIEVISKDWELGRYNDDEGTGEVEKEELRLLKHCLLAHHGSKEYGSPVLPSIPEASILHYADTISSEMYRYNEELNKLKEGEVSVVWTPSGAINFYRRKK